MARADGKRLVRAAYNGQIFTRTTARTYTHVVIGRYEGGDKWFDYSWAGRQDLAIKEKARLEASNARRDKKAEFMVIAVEGHVDG